MNQESKTIAGIAIGVAAALGIGSGVAYLLYKMDQNRVYTPLEIAINEAEGEAQRKIAITRDLIRQEKGMGPGVISKRVIALIYDILSTRCAPHYQEILFDSRKSRRAVMETDLQQYERIVVSASDRIEELIHKNLETIMEEVGVSMDEFEMSNSHWARENPKFAMLGVIALEEMRSSIKPTPGLRAMDKEFMLEIVNFQLEEYPKIEYTPTEPMNISLVKQTILSDRTNKKFGTEEEDLSRHPELRNDPDIKKCLDAVRELVRKEQA